MDKKGVAAVLEEMAMLMELKGENPFRIRSFVNGARTIEALDEDLATVVVEGRLRAIKGIGEALAAIITELFASGESSDL